MTNPDTDHAELARSAEDFSSYPGFEVDDDVVSEKELRSILGLLNHLAPPIFPMRAFLSPLWAALLDSAEARSCFSSKRPSHCVWVKEFRHALVWIKDFLDLVHGSVIPEQWPTKTSGHRRQFTATGRQVWEALTMLVALRFWRCSWLGTRPVLEVKSDSVAALTSMATLKSSPTSNVVAREIALDIALGSLQPDIFSHSPGVSANVLDKLSQRYQPRVQFTIPQLLTEVPGISGILRGGSCSIPLRPILVLVACTCAAVVFGRHCSLPRFVRCVGCFLLPGFCVSCLLLLARGVSVYSVPSWP